LLTRRIHRLICKSEMGYQRYSNKMLHENGSVRKFGIGSSSLLDLNFSNGEKNLESILGERDP
jgi:hypothetical protein